MSVIGDLENVANRALNSVVRPILRSQWNWVLSPFIATITYNGRRSGNRFSTPVLYHRHDNVVTVRVAAPQAKKWWRNFLDDGGPITIDLHGVPHTGHAVARIEHRGRVTVHIMLDSESPDWEPMLNVDG